MTAQFRPFGPETKIKEDLRLLSIPERDLSNLLQIHPRTLSNKLNGYSRLTEEERIKVDAYLKEAKATLAARLANG